MPHTPKIGLDALLRPETSVLVLIDHQPYQFANLHSHEPTMIVNNVIALGKLSHRFVALVRTISAHRFRPKMVGGAMIGPQNTEVRTALGPQLNGFVNYEYWVPVPKLAFPGVGEMLTSYQARAAAAGVDPLGHYMAPLAYAQMQVVAEAIVGTGGFDDAALSTFARGATFRTVMGDVKFGKNGEWAHPRVLQVQFRNIAGHDVEQFKD